MDPQMLAFNANRPLGAAAVPARPVSAEKLPLTLRFRMR